MDPIRAQKIHAMNSYKKNQFLYNLIVHILTALTCTLLCSYPYLSPSLYASMNHFLFVSLPNIRSFFFSPKCLFIVVNVIIVVLVVESKYVSSHSSPVNAIYDEYVERSQRVSTPQEKKEEKNEKKSEMNMIKSSVMSRVEDTEVKEEEEQVKEEEEEEQVKEEEEEEQVKEEEEEEEVVKGKEDDVEEEKNERDGEEEVGLPAEELNKRVEEFIARVNRQRWLEAKSL